MLVISIYRFQSVEVGVEVQGFITRPAQTILVLITDLFEGGDVSAMLATAAMLKQAGVTVVCLLALSDHGAPTYDHGNAAAFAALGISAFACTPELFPELMAAAIQRQDIAQWAARHDIVTAGGLDRHGRS